MSTKIRLAVNLKKSDLFISGCLALRSKESMSYTEQ